MNGLLSRADLDLIAELVPENTSVLDIGCGDGTLLKRLRDGRGVKGYGLEIDGRAVSDAVAAGLSVVQGDADTDLSDYPDRAFDTVILSNSVQALRHPDLAIEAAVRVGRQAIVSFPNFGHWRVRLHLLVTGTMPVSRALPDSWYETDNIHLCTIRDFLSFVRARGIRVDGAYGLRAGQRPRGFSAEEPGRENLLAEGGLFVLSRP